MLVIRLPINNLYSLMQYQSILDFSRKIEVTEFKNKRSQVDKERKVLNF